MISKPAPRRAKSSAAVARPRLLDRVAHSRRRRLSPKPRLPCASRNEPRPPFALLGRLSRAEFLGQLAQQQGRIKRLVEPAVDTAGTAVEVVFVWRMTRHGEDFQPGASRVAPDLAGSGRTVTAGQAHVQQHHVGPLPGAQVVERVAAVARRVHGETCQRR